MFTAQQHHRHPLSVQQWLYTEGIQPSRFIIVLRRRRQINPRRLVHNLTTTTTPIVYTLGFRSRITHHIDVAVAVQTIATPLAEVLAFQGHQVDGDAFGAEFTRLALQGFLEFFPAAGTLTGPEFGGGDRLTGTGLGVGVVGRSAGAFFRVLFLAPLGAPILEPNLKKEREKIISNESNENLVCLKHYFFDN